MIGLLKNHFYGALGSGIVLLISFLVAGIGLLISGSANLLTIFVTISATAFAFIASSSFRREASTKWNKYELTTPVRRKDIVKSRYIGHIAWALGGFILSAIVAGLMVIVHGNLYFYHVLRDALSLFCASMGVATFMGALFYPLIYTLGADKNEIGMVISLIGGAGLTAGILWLINAVHGFKELSDLDYYLSCSAFIAIAIAFYLLSYLLSLLIYRRKEY